MAANVLSVTVTEDATSGTSIVVNLPATVDAGDLLAVFVAAYDDNSAGGDFSGPGGGWSHVETIHDSGNFLAQGIFAKKADGSEDGGTVTISKASTAMVCIAYVLRIEAGTWFDNGSVVDAFNFSAGVNGTGTSGNPPSLTPGGGSHDFLWVTSCMVQNQSAGSLVAGANYTTNDVANDLDGPAEDLTYGISYRSNSASSEDPAAWTWTGSTFYLTHTAAIRPVMTGFPKIPTTNTSRILVTNNTAGGASGVKTFPNLSSLTKNAGDLLIAIVIIYDGNSTNAEFSSWGGSFTEFVDQATTTTMGIGAAYKFSTGSETGTFTVTSADTSTNDSTLILMSIEGAHASTPPEGGTIANGTAAAADPGSFNPGGWDNEKTLWIAVGGSGETSTTGTYTGVTAAPTNYGFYFQSGITADAVGGVEGAVAFRQVEAASEDVGGFTVDLDNARNSALLIAVRPASSDTPASVSPSVIARSVTMPAATAKGAASTTPATTARSAVLPAPTVKGAARTTPAVISRSAVLPAATVKGGAVTNPDVTARSVVIPQATAADSGAPATVAPDAIVRSATLPAPVVKGAAVVTPAVIDRVVSVHAVTLKGGAVTSPAVSALAAVIPQASAAAGVTSVSPATIARSAALGAVTVRGGATVTVAAIATAATLPTVLVQTAATVTPDTILIVVQLDQVTAFEGEPPPDGTMQDGDLLVLAVDGAVVVSGMSGAQTLSNLSGRLTVGSQG